MQHWAAVHRCAFPAPRLPAVEAWCCTHLDATAARASATRAASELRRRACAAGRGRSGADLGRRGRGSAHAAEESCAACVTVRRREQFLRNRGSHIPAREHASPLALGLQTIKTHVHDFTRLTQPASLKIAGTSAIQVETQPQYTDLNRLMNRLSPCRHCERGADLGFEIVPRSSPRAPPRARRGPWLRDPLPSSLRTRPPWRRP